MWKVLMWLAVLATIGSCVTLPHIGWIGWLGVWFLWHLADSVEKQDARILELEARQSPYDDVDADLDRAVIAAIRAKEKERQTIDDAQRRLPRERDAACASCGRVLMVDDRFCAGCGTARPIPECEEGAPTHIRSPSDAVALEKVTPNTVVDHPELGRCIVVGVDWETMRGQKLRFVILRVNRTQKLERIGILTLASSGARVVR